MTDRPQGPLSDVLVVDLTHALSGPYCTLLMAELGARVIKIERAPIGDAGRNFAPFVDGKPVFFQLMNRGKESIALDIESLDDRPVLEEMFRRADVVVENFRPGTLDRHGFGYDALCALNPRIVLASITCKVLGHGELVGDPRYGSPVDRVEAYDTLRPVLADALKPHTVDELIDLLQPVGVACGRINTVGRAIEDAQTYARNMIVDAAGLRVVGNPIKMSTADDPPTRAPAPDLDADGTALRTEFAR
jgi:crotonobetainyl-CoA:carnitine CoA-transferase CaiB-like acyl-CoA transferase